MESQNPNNHKKSTNKKSSRSLRKSTSFVLAGSDLDRQQRRDVRRMNHLLKKYDRHTFEENLANQQPTSSVSDLNNTLNNSVDGPSTFARPLRIIRNNSLSSDRPSSSKSSYDRGRHRRERKESQPTELDDLKRYIGSAFKNSLGHVHDHIIATLPTDMSLYYQKLHDTLLMDTNSESTESQKSNENSTKVDNVPVMNEMHEFISASQEDDPSTSNGVYNAIANNNGGEAANIYHSAYNPYAPPMAKPGILPIRDFLQDPLNASISTLNRVTNLVRLPTSQLYNHGYNIINNLSTPVNPLGTPGSTRPPGMAERVVRKDDNQYNVSLPPPVLPLIQCTHAQMRMEPLGLEEFQSMKQPITVEQLKQRVFKGGISEELRLQLWPFILGLCNDEQLSNVIQPNEHFDWTNHELLFEHYRQQWKLILPDQEKRFMLFRERKSLIERDVIRCDRTHPFYQGDNNENLNKLKELLLTYMMYDFDTGYVQGMSDLASPLLYVAEGDTCKAFWFFVKIMQFTNNNFEMSQLTIKHQLEMLWKLIELTDPIFAQYLANNDSVNCYFAFRWIVCQFKREFMKCNSDDYQEVLLLWESIWTCASMKQYFIKLKQEQTLANKSNDDEQSSNTLTPVQSEQVSSTNDTLVEKSELPQQDNEQNEETLEDKQTKELSEKFNQQCKIDKQETISHNENTEESIQSDQTTPPPPPQSQSSSFYVTSERRLSDTELYVLCICLAIIRRERDLIMAQRFDATEILKHFNTLFLTSNLKQILIHAANIWSWLIFDGNDKLLYCNHRPDEQHKQQAKNIVHSSNNNNNNADRQSSNTNNDSSNNTNQFSNVDTEEFDLLQDLRLPLDRHMSSGEDYFLFG